MTVPGMGGIPPMPPGYVPPGLPDTAAGSTNIFRGRLVLVFGPAGTVSGIFVYQQGTTPGPGNTPIVSITNSTTDPFGNPVQPTIQITGTGTLEVGSAPNTQVQLRTSSGVSGLLAFLFNNAAFSDSQVIAGIVGGTFAALSIQGPASTVVGFRDKTRVQLNSSDAVSSFGNTQFVYTDDGGADHVFASEDARGFRISVCGQLTAADPSVTPTAASPAIPETWHDLRPLQNLFVGTIAGHYPLQCRKTSEGDVEIFGYVQFPAAAANYNSVTFATLPAAYRSGSNSGLKGYVNLETNVAPVGTPTVQADTTGNLQFHNTPITGLQGTIAFIWMRYPLDNTGMILS